MKPRSQLTRFRRQLHASLRDTWLLLREFAWPLLFLTAAVTGGGFLYWSLARFSSEPVNSLSEAVYLVLSLIFFQPNGDFPHTWYLAAFYFAMPVIGLMILAQGVADFGLMLFNRRQRGKEWEMAVASTFNRHHILIGLGHLGYRVANQLHQMGQEIVVVELNPAAHLVSEIKRLGIPVIDADAARLPALEAAGAARANSIILCTPNDSLNLQIALNARRLNPEIRVILRIFDEDFAAALQEQFGFTAFSATDMAAPAFAAAAAGVDLTRPITIEGQTMSLGRLKVQPGHSLDGAGLGEVEQRYNLSIVLLRRGDNNDAHPDISTILQAGDSLAVLGGSIEISNLIQANLQPGKGK